jgi:hypothetical protein
MIDISVVLMLNQIVCELPSEHPLSETRPLRELLGHTPTQVCSNVLFIVFFQESAFYSCWQNESDGLLALWLCGYQVNLKLADPTSPCPHFTWQRM